MACNSPPIRRFQAVRETREKLSKKANSQNPSVTFGFREPGVATRVLDMPQAVRKECGREEVFTTEEAMNQVSGSRRGWAMARAQVRPLVQQREDQRLVGREYQECLPDSTGRRERNVRVLDAARKGRTYADDSEPLFQNDVPGGILAAVTGGVW
jgi:hypothetical protein